jgi:RNA polymerase primary sigma factor
MAYPDHFPIKSDPLGILLDKADMQGYLTPDDILAVQPDDEMYDRMLALLQKRGVNIFDQDRVESEWSESTLNIRAAPKLDNVSIDDPVGLYFREMSQVPLLSQERELHLAQAIERACLARSELSKMNRNCTAARRHELFNLIQEGFRAREHLIKANTRLVVSIAKRYMGQGLPLLDLIQEGNLGLMKAIEKYDYHKGFRFSTYATWWIRQTITRSVADQGRTIRVPVHMSDRIRQMKRLERDLEQSMGRPPTDSELADQLAIPVSRIQWMRRISWQPISLESPMGDDEDSEFGMFIEDESSPTPAQAIYQIMLGERVSEVLSSLTPREARVIRLRFGLDKERPHTLEEVGQKFGLTRERIRQIEVKALRRLRHPSRSRRLQEYL